jgi:anti-anti-sigma regulatory factor
MNHHQNEETFELPRVVDEFFEFSETHVDGSLVFCFGNVERMNSIWIRSFVHFLIEHQAREVRLENIPERLEREIEVLTQMMSSVRGMSWQTDCHRFS